MNDAVYQIITDRIIDLLNKGTIPWHKTWNSKDSEPRNLISKKAYILNVKFNNKMEN